ncbi:prion-like-(Q/N-rich) domain-bearing protein 25 isoform X2 [Wyeomyia smithii]|uniref:prion-like-(Q/N-rich) domain-bearing protein 25 isoform X2 n=1 Tax=Wyeomyia smithii TaxID=174621 RepID=UPI002467AF88|nr:prion-like-(Q/N-rich) domain-bearing protein 25 isoform X2 [Wyeomyia smithii]
MHWLAVICLAQLYLLSHDLSPIEAVVICVRNKHYDDGTIRSRSVLWPCIIGSDDCSKVPRAQCSIYGFCQCPAGHVFSTDVTRCLPESLYGVACEEAVQCSHMLTGAKCDGGFCTCDTDYTYVRGRCRQLANLHEPCTDDIDCFFSYNREAVVCRNNACECALGFYERSTNVCRRRVSLGDACLVNEDCSGDEVECLADKCTSTAESKTFRDVGIQVRSLEKVETKEASWNSQQQQQTSNSRQSSFSEEHGGRRDSSTSGSTAKRFDTTAAFGDSCAEEMKECTGLRYSVCKVGQCHCREGFYNVDGACKAELGEHVDFAEDCGGGNFSPEGRCVCANNQFYNYHMRTCLKGVLGINTSCTASSQCSPYGEAYCTSAPPKRCTCYPYAEYDAKRQMCVRKTGYEQYCEADQHCPLANAECSEENTCVCKTNYFYVNERCKAAKGGSCDAADDCGFDKAKCEPEAESESKQCDCIKGHIYHDQTCLKEAEEYEEECVTNEQCRPLLGSLAKCMDNKCKCDESGTHYKDGQCQVKKTLNERCDRSSQCYVEEGDENVECRNSSCQCKFDFTTDVERQRCVKPSRGKNASGRPSPLKVITLALTGAAILITGSALRDAYYM